MPLDTRPTLPRTFFGSSAPSNGTDHVYTITIGGTPTGGTFKLGLNGETTSSIAWSSTNNTLLANIDAALEALRYVGSGGMTCAAASLTNGIGTLTITGTNQMSKRLLGAMTIPVKALTGASPTITVATTTAGVNAGARGATNGSQMIDVTTGLVYQNFAGATAVPAWALANGIFRIPPIALAGATIQAATTVAWTNPYSFSVIVTHAVLHVATIATAAGEMDIGTTAVGATTLSDNLLDGVDVHSATGVFDNITDAGTNGKSRQIIATGKFLTCSVSSGDLTGLVGTLHVFFVPVL